MNVLVVGANGQLGAACCRALAADGHVVRGSVRARSRAEGLDLGGAHLVESDLTGGGSLDPLLDGVEAIVLTANSAVPRAGDDPARLNGALIRLVDVAGASGVRRVVLPSLPVSTVDEQVPLAAERRRLEEEVRRAVPGSVILRFPPFMECWLALAGSSVPLRGEPNPTVGRPSPFLRQFRKGTGSIVEKRGLMLVPGPTTRRQAFIAVADAAAACVAAVSRPELAGGPSTSAAPRCSPGTTSPPSSPGCSAAGCGPWRHRWASSRWRRRCSARWPRCRHGRWRSTAS